MTETDYEKDLKQLKQLIDILDEMTSHTREKRLRYEEAKAGRKAIWDKISEIYLRLVKVMPTYSIAREIGFEYQNKLYPLMRTLRRRKIL